MAWGNSGHFFMQNTWWYISSPLRHLHLHTQLRHRLCAVETKIKLLVYEVAAIATLLVLGKTNPDNNMELLLALCLA